MGASALVLTSSASILIFILTQKEIYLGRGEHGPPVIKVRLFMPLCFGFWGTFIIVQREADLGIGVKPGAKMLDGKVLLTCCSSSPCSALSGLIFTSAPRCQHNSTLD